jgi:hypothetical protein
LTILSDNILSRREFILTAGGIVVFSAGAGRTVTTKCIESVNGLLDRCGKLRIGYSCAGNVAMEQVETKHAQQVSYVLSLWQSQTTPHYYSTGAVSEREGRPFLNALMTTLSGEEGMRFEVVTSRTSVSGPEFMLRGESGILSASEGSLWFSESTETFFQKEKVCAFPECCIGRPKLSGIEFTARPEYTRVAGKIIDDARNRLLTGSGSLC